MRAETFASNGGDEGDAQGERATLAPGPDVPPDIARGLASLGTTDASGAIRIEWRTGAR